MRFYSPLFAFAFALIGAGAQAATVIEMESGPARLRTTMTVEKDKARLQSELTNYNLIDPVAEQFFYVLQDKKQVVKMYGSTPGLERKADASPKIKTKLTDKGPGPKIAGYPTRLYQLHANGALCVSTYLSREAMMQEQLKQFHSAFYRMQLKQMREAKASGAEMTPCADAEGSLMARYAELGLPMKTIFPNGQIRQEIVSIKTGVEVGAGYFQLPTGFKQMTYEEHLREMEQGGMSLQDQASEKAETKQEPAATANK